MGISIFEGGKLSSFTCIESFPCACCLLLPQWKRSCVTFIPVCCSEKPSALIRMMPIIASRLTCLEQWTSLHCQSCHLAAFCHVPSLYWLAKCRLDHADPILCLCSSPNRVQSLKLAGVCHKAGFDSDTFSFLGVTFGIHVPMARHLDVCGHHIALKCFEQRWAHHCYRVIDPRAVSVHSVVLSQSTILHHVAFLKLPS